MVFNAIVSEDIEDGKLVVSSMVTGGSSKGKPIYSMIGLYDVLVDVLNGGGGFGADSSLGDIKTQALCVFDNRTNASYLTRFNYYNIFRYGCGYGYNENITISPELEQFVAEFQDQQHNVETFNNLVESRESVPNKTICYKFDNLHALLEFAIYKAAENDQPIKQCINCGRFFLAYQDNARYCTNASPQAPNKNCQQYVSYAAYCEVKRGDGIKAIHTKLFSALSMRAKRSKTAADIKAKDDYYMDYQLKSHELKLGEITEAEMVLWLDSVKQSMKS